MLPHIVEAYGVEKSPARPEPHQGHILAPTGARLLRAMTMGENIVVLALHPAGNAVKVQRNIVIMPNQSAVDIAIGFQVGDYLGAIVLHTPGGPVQCQVFEEVAAGPSILNS